MAQQQAGALVNLVPLFLVFGIFYFMVIRPQQKREKEHQKMLEAVAKNDDVITASGIHGTVVSVKEKTVLLRVDENVKIEFDKSAIAVVTKKNQAAA